MKPAAHKAHESHHRGDSLRLESSGRALRHRNFQLFFSGQLISLIGTWMQNIAQAWLVYRLTGSGLMLGSVGFASQIPIFLLSPIGGMAADHLDRRKVVIATQSASMVLALILALLTLLNRVHVWHVFVLASLLGVVNAFDLPGRQSFLVEMVGKEDLMNAIALNSSMFNGARILGPAVAGIVVAKVGEGWCFFANGISYIAVIAGLLLMRVSPRPRHRIDTSPLEHVLEGFRFIERTSPIKALLLLLGVVSLVGTPYTVLMPIFADQILHAGGQEMAALLRSHDLGAVRMGILMGASGIGALLAGLTLAARTRVIGLGRWVAWACGGFGVFLFAFSFSTSFWLSVAILLPVGYCIMLQSSASNTLIQAMVPDHLRGRVMSVYAMMLMGMAPIGAFFGGALADRLGAPLTVAIGSVGCILTALYFGWKLPTIRVEGHRLILAQAMAGGEPAQEMQGQIVRD